MLRTVLALALTLPGPAWSQATPPSVTFRNGTGVNTTCLASRTLPVLGSDWILDVDASALPNATATFIEGRLLPANGPIVSIGEILIDRSSTFLFRTFAAPTAGTATHTVRVPANSELSGLAFSIQAWVGTPPLALCNAEDAVLGTVPILTAAFSASPTTGLAPLSVHFTDLSSGAIQSWLWDFGDGNTSTAQNPTHVYSIPASATVSLTVTGPNGTATETKPAYITVQDPVTQHNVLLILADDLGVADVVRYGLNPSLPPDLTPNIDFLADQGVLFENAWSQPFCSPTRAALLTGRHASRTGIGAVIGKGTISLSPSETTLPEAISAFGAPGTTTAAFGKWHLQATGDPTLCAPTAVHGFGSFLGSIQQVNGSYCLWQELACPAGVETSRFTYMPAVVLDESANWIAAQTGQWFAYVAPQSPYEIYHVPPASLQNQITGTTCERWRGPKRQAFEAAVQALDTKLGDLLATLGPNWSNTTTIVFAGDNGTPSDALVYWPAGRGKGTLYQGGLSVPLLIAGHGVTPSLRGTRTSELVQLTDLYRMIAGWSGANTLPTGIAEDSIDLRPLLDGTSTTTGRTYAFAEHFSSNGPAPSHAGHKVAVRNVRFKLIWSCETSAPLAFFDLSLDPLELTDLLLGGIPPAGTPSGDAFIELRGAIQATFGC